MKKLKIWFDALIDSGVLTVLLIAATVTALILLMQGCVAIEVEDYGQQAVVDSAGNPVVDSNGVVQTVHKGQRWHYNKNMVEQSVEEIGFARKPGDDVTVNIKNYKDVVSQELNKVVDTSFKGAAELAAKIGAAIATSGGSVAGEAARSAISKAIARFQKKGGDASKATVTCNGKDCTISDGTVTETCEDCVLPGWVEPDPVP